MRCAITRPSTSVGPPAANGMIMVTGRVGKFCACRHRRRRNKGAPNTRNALLHALVSSPPVCGALPCLAKAAVKLLRLSPR